MFLLTFGCTTKLRKRLSRFIPDFSNTLAEDEFSTSQKTFICSYPGYLRVQSITERVASVATPCPQWCLANTNPSLDFKPLKFRAIIPARSAFSDFLMIQFRDNPVWSFVNKRFTEALVSVFYGEVPVANNEKLLDPEHKKWKFLPRPSSKFS